MRQAPRCAMWALIVGAMLASSPVRGGAIEIDTKDGTRTAILVQVGPDPAPTVIVLHGATIGAEWTMRGSGFIPASLRFHLHDPRVGTERSDAAGLAQEAVPGLAYSLCDGVVVIE
jgi:hypothetical protein